MKLIATRGWFVLALVVVILPIAHATIFDIRPRSGDAIRMGFYVLKDAVNVGWVILIGLIYHLIVRISAKRDILYLAIAHLICNTATTALGFYFTLQRMRIMEAVRDGDYETGMVVSAWVAGTSSLLFIIGYLCFGIALILAMRRVDRAIPATFD